MNRIATKLLSLMLAFTLFMSQGVMSYATDVDLPLDQPVATSTENSGDGEDEEEVNSNTGETGGNHENGGEPATPNTGSGSEGGDELGEGDGTDPVVVDEEQLTGDEVDPLLGGLTPGEEQNPLGTNGDVKVTVKFVTDYNDGKLPEAAKDYYVDQEVTGTTGEDAFVEFKNPSIVFSGTNNDDYWFRSVDAESEDGKIVDRAFNYGSDEYTRYAFTFPDESTTLTITIHIDAKTIETRDVTVRAANAQGGTFYYNYSDKQTEGRVLYGNRLDHNGFRIAKYPGDAFYGMVFIPDPGYYLKGVYSDADHNNKVTGETLLTKENGVVADENDKNPTFTLYPEWERITYTVIYNNDNQDDPNMITTFGTVKEGEKYPKMQAPYRPGYKFGGWYTYFNGKKTTLSPESTVFKVNAVKKNDYYILNYGYDSKRYDETNHYYTEVDATYTQQTYNVTFHFNNSSKDVSVKKAYTIKDKNKSINLYDGDLSANSSIGDTSKFVGWKASKEGTVEFDCVDGNPTVLDVIKYADGKAVTNIDLYADWSEWSENNEQYSYKLIFDYGVDDNVLVNGEFAESAEGFKDADGKPVKVTEDLAFGAKRQLTGTEYKREYYQLAYWEYERSDGKTGRFQPDDVIMLRTNKAVDSITLKAVWYPVTYKVSYNFNGGSPRYETTYKDDYYSVYSGRNKEPLYNYSWDFLFQNDHAELLPENQQEVYKIGYRFDGWFDNTTQYTYIGGDIYRDINVTAKWTVKDYNVVYDLNAYTGETIVDKEAKFPEGAESSFDLTYGAVYPKTLVTPTRTGYKFAGWFTAPTGGTQIVGGKTKFTMSAEPADGKAKVYAHWTSDKYTVNYHSNDGDKDVKVAKTYTLAADGTKKLTLAENDIKDNAAFKNKVGFLGWATKDGTFFDGKFGYDVADVIRYASANRVNTVDLYAQWKPNTYSVVFDSTVTNNPDLSEESQFADNYMSEGKVVHEETVAVGETVLLSGKEFVREGYTLTGWTYPLTNGKTATIKANGSFKNLAAADGEVTLTAQWAVNNYKITYNFNGGKAKDKTIKNTASYNKKDFAEKTALLNYTDELAVKDELDVFKTGYVFNGWKASDAYYKYFGGDVYQNLTLTAQWSPIIYVVECVGEGGQIGLYDTHGVFRYYDDSQTSVPYNVAYSLKKATFTRPGYKLSNWLVKDSEGNVIKTYATNATIKNLYATYADGLDKNNNPNMHELVLHANWTPESYKITYNLNGGALPRGVKNATKYDTKTGLATINSPTKAGFTFTGWEMVAGGEHVTGENLVAADRDSDPSGYAASASINPESYGNVTLKALWEAKNYTVSFHNADDQEYATKYDGYWYVNKLMFNDAAKGIESEVSGDEGSIIGFATSLENANKKKVAYQLSKEYVVSKMFGNPDQQEIVLYPVWGNTKIYHISYALPDEAKLSKGIYTYTQNDNAETTLPTVSKTGYVFEGYEEISNINDNSVNADSLAFSADKKKLAKGYHENIILKPILTPITYTISISPNAKGVTDNRTAPATVLENKVTPFGTYDYKGEWVAGNELDKLPGEGDWTRPGYGYTFKGFSTSAKGTKPIESLEKLSAKANSKVTLYAIWEADKHSVTYSDRIIIDGQPNSSAVTIGVLGTNVELPYGKALTPAKVNLSNVVFLGWTLKSGDPNGVVLKNGYVTSIKNTNMSNIELQANFAWFTYKLSFAPNGGTYNGRKANVVINSAAKFSADVYGQVENLVSTTRSGYTLRCIALDKNGKTPVLDPQGNVILEKKVFTNPNNSKYLAALATKNKGAATLFAVWDKVAPAKPASVTATLANGMLNVNTHESANQLYAYEIEYSTNRLFWGGNTTVMTDYNETSKDNLDVYGTQYYVRVRRVQKDSTGADIRGAWSETVRASKTVASN